MVDYSRTEELKAFDETKAGVKGLVDAGTVSIPNIFIRPPQELAAEQQLNICHNNIQLGVLPIIDLSNIHESSLRRQEIVDQVRVASAKWGFFQVINHGIPLTVMDDMIEGIRLFNEQDLEVKQEFYSRDPMKKVRFNTNYDLYRSRTANWRDTLSCSSLDLDLFPEDLPSVCRESTIEYAKHMKMLGETLFGLLSEALGVEADRLWSMECGKDGHLSSHYYPACPQPELTLGATQHADPGFLTLLLTNHISGLQFLHEGQWLDVHPIPGGLVVNISDLLQIVSNDKFKSAEHRVIANRVGPRISTACFFSGPISMADKIYGPIPELISEANPPRYKQINVRDYVITFASRPLDEKNIDLYKL